MTIARLLHLVAAVTALSAATAAVAANAPSYVVAQTVALGAPDRCDYVTFDMASGRVYVAHGDRVSVVDGHTGVRIGEVTGMPGGAHGVAISHATGEGFTDDGEAGVVRAFDLKILEPGQTYKAADDAVAWR